MEEHTVELTKYKKYLGFDQAKFEEKSYMTHSPGSGGVYIPAYLVVKFVRDTVGSDNYKLSKSNIDIDYWLVMILTMPGIIALSLIAFCYTLKQFKVSNALFWTLMLYCGTLLLPYSTIGLTEPVTFSFLTICYSFFMLSTLRQKSRDLALCAISLAVAVAVKQNNLLYSLPLGFYWLIRKDIKFILITASFCLAALASILIHNYIVFKDPLSFNIYHFAPKGIVRSSSVSASSVFAISEVSITKLWTMLFSQFRGLFYFSPILFISFLGFFSLKKNKHRGVLLVNLGALFLALIFFLTFKGWANGANYGWRYSLVMLPNIFFFMALSIDLKDIGRIGRFFWGSIALISVVHASIGLLDGPWVEPKYTRKEHIWSYGYERILESGPNLSKAVNSHLVQGALLLMLGILVFAIFIKFKYAESQDAPA